MHSERWQKIESIFHSALDRDPSQRAAFLENACAGDEALRQEVESLLNHSELAGDVLSGPATREIVGAPSPVESHPIGRNMLHYQVIGLLGAGGMGEVYEARDTKLGRNVAIKLLPKDSADDAEYRVRFQLEARILASLNHPHIATLYGLEHSDGVDFLVMEVVPGQTLAERLRKGSLRAKDALKIAGQIAEALEAAHERGVIHRDLKPANVKVTADGSVKILDFGLAKALAADTEVDLSQVATVSEEGCVVGTPMYMSPEQACGKAVDKRTDIWAFGCVLYEMLAGRRAFTGRTMSDLVDAILEREPDWDALPATTPVAISSLIRHCLHKDLQHRLRDVGDARIEIADVLAGLSGSGSQITVDGRTTIIIERRYLSRIIVAACIIVGLTAGGVTLWWLGHPHVLPSQVTEQELTANASDNPVYAAAISPDGKYLAFADYDGVFLRILETRQTHKVPLPENLCFRCASLSWFRDGNNLAVVGPSDTGRPALWLISIFGGAPRKLLDDVVRASVSPDGAHIGFIGKNESDIWVVNPDGEDAKKLASVAAGGRFIELQWSPDSHQLAYLESRPEPEGNRIEISDLTRGASTLLLADSMVRTFCWASDGRIILSRAEAPPNQKDSNLWIAPVQGSDRKLGGEPHRITDWPGFSFWDLTATSDAKQLAFVRQSAHMTVYISRVINQGELSDPIRLTLDEQNHLPSGWATDGQSVLFDSDRDASWAISRQNVGGRTAEDVVTESQELGNPRSSPDKQWILYWSHQTGAATHSWHLLRMPSAGGASEAVLQAAPGAEFRCPTRATAPCVLGEMSADRKQILFTAFDPVQGKKNEAATVNISPNRQPLWDLSPDGSVLAIGDLDEKANHITVLRIATQGSNDLSVDGATELSGLAWDSNGHGLFVTSVSNVGNDLIKLEFDGKQKKLWTTTTALASPVPSPDGKWLAFAEGIETSNAWTIKNF